MRKLLSSVVLVAMLLVISFGFAAKSNPVKAQNADIAVLLPDSQSSARWENDDRKYFQQAFDAAGVTYSIVNAQGDKNTQATQADAAITNGAKVIALVNLDSASAAAIIDKAHAAGVKVIDYDRLTIEGPGADFYVSFDGEAVGRLQGLGVLLAVNAAGIKNPRVAFLNGSPTDNNATLFSNGAHQILDLYLNDKTSGWTKVDEQWVPDWDNTKAQTIFEQMLTASGGKIDAAYAANDGLGHAVSVALENAGLPFIPTSGQDATVGGIQDVLLGRISMTVYKAIKAEADGAAQLAIALVKGDDTSKLTTGSVNNGTNDVPSVLLTPIGVNKDNIAATVIADGFRTWDEICTGDVAAVCPAH
jgi:D-xylose transport system substrate-binding protein